MSENSSPFPIIRHAWLRFWRRPALIVARFTLGSYLRSGWFLGDIVYIWFLYALFFFEYGGGVSYFYGTVGPALSVLAVLDTVIMVQRSFKTARLYLPLAHLSSRASYIRGLLVATAVWRVPTFLLMLLLAASFHRGSPLGIQDATLVNILPGAIGLLINCVILSTLTVLLSPPIVTRVVQIGFLVWVVAVLYSSSSAGPIAHDISVISSIPLAPIQAGYTVGLTRSSAGTEWFLLLLAIGYIVAMAWLAERWLARRDLIFF